MEVQYGPNAIDEPDLLYKLQRKIKVFNTSNSLPNRGYNLVASCSKYGIVFLLAPNSILSAYYLKDLIDKECEPHHTTLKLQTEATHIAVNCDQEWLAVISKTMLFVYKIMDFQNPNISPAFSLKLDVNPSTFVSAVQWNPCIPDTIAIAFFDGTLLVSQVTTMQVKKMQTNVRCICWSPKGKQIVTGNNDGTLCQYKPDLSPMKTVPAPNLFEGAPVEALAIHWISTYQFLVVYKHATDNVRPAVAIVNTPKGGHPSCMNFEDICYSLGSNRPWYYYLYGLPQWNMVLTSSSNSSEIATLASIDGSNWQQWCQIDEARPELPLTDGNQDNYPVGLAVDTCAIHQLPWGENETLPPMPLLHVLSHTGMLSIFNIINLKKGASSVCTPPLHLTLPATAMTSSIPDDVPQSVTITSSAPPSQPMPQPVQYAPPPLPAEPPQLATQLGQSFGGSNFTAAPQQFSLQKSQITQGLFSASTPQVPEIKPTETTPQAPVAQSVASSSPEAIRAEISDAQSPGQAQEINDALRSEQERVNTKKVNEELMSMLIREVNDFQMELYRFQVKTKEAHIKLQKEIESMGSDINIKAQDVVQLKKDSAVQEFREAVIMLKLDLVRVCAAVAEARTHAETRYLQQWCQADPLTVKRVATVKKLAYYVQTQLDQAHKALDHKWNEMTSRIKNERAGERMMRPILDDIYQPLVRQQEILTRQQAVLKTLRNALKECGDVAPLLKTTSIFRSTPFRNKADPISKVTNSVLNMTLESAQDAGREHMMSSQKLDALRDLLSNHKTVKIKPVNIELRQQMMEMRLKYQNSMKEKEATEAKSRQTVNTEPQPTVQPTIPDSSVSRAAEVTKSESKDANATASLINVPTYKPFSNVQAFKPGMANVARTLFPDDPKSEPVKFQTGQSQPQVSVQAAGRPEQGKPTNVITVTSTTLALLKDMLQSKSQANSEPKNDANTFLGQPICSPAAFGANSKPQPFNVNMKSSETGEAEASSIKLEEKPTTNVFTLKSSAPLATVNIQNVPDVLKTSNQAASSKVDASKDEVKDKDKSVTKLKEKVIEKENKKLPNEPLKQTDDKKDETKPFSLSNKPQAVTAAQPTLQTSKSQVVSATTTQVTTVFQPTITSSTPVKESTRVQKTEAVATPISSSIFGAAFAAQKSANSDSKPTSSSGLIFGTKTPSSIFGSSIFGISNTSNTTTTASTAKSIFGSAVLSTTFPTSTTTSAIAEPKTTVSVSEADTSKAQTQVNSLATTSTTETRPVTSSTEATVTTQSLFTTSTAPVFGTSTTSSVFGSVPTTTQSELKNTTTITSQQPVLGGAAAQPSLSGKETPSTQASIFGTTTKTVSSVFETPTATTQGSVFGTSSTTQASIFGTPTTTTKTSIFGTPTTTQASIFGTPTATTQATVFGTPTTTTQASVFGTPTTTTQASVFGTPTTTTQASVFGTPTATTQASIFGTSSATTQASIFGTPTATTQASIFGTPTATTQASIFGTSPAITQASIFGTSPATTQASIFGTPTATTQASIFGTPTATTQASIFGTPTATTQASIFGTPTATTQASIFGTPAATTQASVFGATTNQASIFGTPTTTTQASIFGTSTTTTQASIFGSPTTTTQASIFGTPPTTQSTSLFGGAEGNLFAAATISTTSASTPASGGNIFGGSSGSIFGGGSTNVFGGKATFGQSNQSAASIFGAANATLKQDSTSNNFWGSGNTSGNAFGSSGFGQQATTQASIFGGGGGSFSAPATGQPLGSPQTSAFGGEANPSVFGSPQQQSAPAFGGGSPVFGSKPVFGQSASFGSSAGFGGFGGLNKSPTGGFGAPATFGGAPAFGAPAFGGTSPGKVFGGASPTPGFGSPTQSNSTFESLATQNTITFGNLAQQSAQQSPPPSSFNTSPSFTGWRG